jgi:Leucine-rich repeat (LRR) protein
VDLRLDFRSPEFPYGKYFAQLQNLQELFLWDANLSRKDMLLLRNSTQLTVLDLTHCSIDDGTAAGLLGSLTALESLTLVQRPDWDWPGRHVLMSDVILPIIESQLKSLRYLDLRSPGVSDASVELLEGLTQLTELNVYRLSGHNVDRLRQVLPGCRVTSTEHIRYMWY